MTKDESLLSYTLYLADSSVVMGHRLSEWAAHGPTLEQDIAISNIALDLIGQSRNFFQYAAQLKGLGATEDTLAYFRDEKDYKNLLITELPNNDWAHTTLKIFFFSTFQYFLYNKLLDCADKQMAAIAEKSLKEVTYHVRWSSEWLIRLGDGTEESHSRIDKALSSIYPYTQEMFIQENFESTFQIDITDLQKLWVNKIIEVLDEATLKIPGNIQQHVGGKRGEHTHHLSTLLEEMQQLQRAYPGCEW